MRHSPLEERAAEIETLAQTTDIVYDATGEKLARLTALIHAQNGAVCQLWPAFRPALSRSSHHPPTQWFHIRNVLDAVSAAQWQALFAELWPLLRQSQLNDASLFPLAHWQRPSRCIKRRAGRANPARFFR
jgi:hypothetical protein